MKKKLETKCWELIDSKTSEAVASETFVINQATLEKLLERESRILTKMLYVRQL